MNNNFKEKKLFIASVIAFIVLIAIFVTHDVIAANNTDDNKTKEFALSLSENTKELISKFIGKDIETENYKVKEEDLNKSQLDLLKKCSNEDELSKEEKLDCEIVKRELFLQKRKENIKKNLIHPEGDIHVVSVYEGKNITNIMKPGKNTDNKRYSAEITVTIKKSEEPVSLVLSSYEPIIWKIKTDNPTDLKEIFLSSYYDSDVIPPKDNIPVKNIKHIDIYDVSKIELEETFAPEPKSIQYEYTGDNFVVDGKSNVKYDEIIEHKSTDKKVFLTCDKYSCALSDDKLSYAIKRGGFLDAITNKYYKSGKYYFETQFFVKQNGIHTAGTNVGICSPYYPYETGCDFFRPDDEDKTEKYGILSWASKIKDKDIIGIAVDFDEGKIYYSINGEWQDCIPQKGKTLYIFTPKGKEYTAAFSIAQDVSITANFGAKKFKYKVPKGFKPYDEYSSKKKLFFL